MRFETVMIVETWTVVFWFITAYCIRRCFNAGNHNLEHTTLYYQNIWPYLMLSIFLSLTSLGSGTLKPHKLEIKC